MHLLGIVFTPGVNRMDWKRFEEEDDAADNYDEEEEEG